MAMRNWPLCHILMLQVKKKVVDYEIGVHRNSDKVKKKSYCKGIAKAVINRSTSDCAKQKKRSNY